MKNFLIKIIFALSVSVTSFLFVDIKEVKAECQILNANFRTLGQNGQPMQQISISNWYTDNVRPYVYVDVQTLGCNGQTIQFSLTEFDDALLNPTGNLQLNINSDDVNGMDLSDQDIMSGFSCTNQSYCIDNRPVPIGAAASGNNFTVVLRAGEDECDQVSDIDCRYFVRINDDWIPSSAINISQVQRLEYNCDSLCDEDWTWIDVISYLQTHPNDPALATDDTSNSNTTTTAVGVTNVPVDIENPIGASDMTIIDFIEKIIDFAITVGIPIVAIAIIYSGLLFVTARGNSSQIETAKNAFTYAVIGGALLLGAWIFARIIRDALNSLAMIMNYFV